MRVKLAAAATIGLIGGGFRGGDEIGRNGEKERERVDLERV